MTNSATYYGLKEMAKLIDSELKARTAQGVVDEIKAWTRLLVKHLGEQKKHLNQSDNLRYKYDKQEDEIQLLKGDKVVARL
jgi:hypothetical protein